MLYFVEAFPVWFFPFLYKFKEDKIPWWIVLCVSVCDNLVTEKYGVYFFIIFLHFSLFLGHPLSELTLIEGIDTYEHINYKLIFTNDF